MLKFFLMLNILSNPWFYFNRIQESNILKAKASQAYQTHFYSEAIGYYTELLTKYEPTSDEIKLNLAHSYYKAQNYSEAAKIYTELSLGTDLNIRSTALCQLGIIQHRNKRYKLALFYFKEAIRINPENKIAVFNYEFLKIAIQKTDSEGGGKGKNANESGQNPDGKNNNQTENKFDADGTGESSIYFDMMYEQKRLSKERAEKILQYIQEQEMQYYNQIKKHVPKDVRKPDW